MKGFKKLEQIHINFMVEATVSSRVAESFQQELMEDSRLALRYEELIGVLSEELLWVCKPDEAVWARLAALCDYAGAELANRCIQQ